MQGFHTYREPWLFNVLPALIILATATAMQLQGQTRLDRLGALYISRDVASQTHGVEGLGGSIDSLMDGASWTPAVMLWRGEEMIESHKLGRARYLMTRIEDEHPNTSAATFALLQQGMIALEEKSYGRARIYFDEAIIKGTADETAEGTRAAGTALYMIAYTQALEGEQPVETTVTLLQELLENYPGHPRETDALYMLGEIAEMKGQYTTALEYYDRITHHWGNEPRFEARNHRAQCLARLRRYQEAQDELMRVQYDLDSLWAAGRPVWNQDQMHADCMLLRGELEIVLNNYSAAEYAFVRLMNGGLLYRRRGLLGLADTYHAAGRNDSALAIYTRLIAEDSSDAVQQRAEFSRGLVLQALANRDEAEKVFETIGADSLHLMNDRALVELALIRYREQEYAAASAILSRAIAIADDEQTRIRAYVIKGVTELGGGEPAKAITSFEAAENLSAGFDSYHGPELAEAKLLSGITLARTNRPAEAVTTLNRFIQLYPSHSGRDEAMFWLGESYYQSGLYRTVIEILEDLIERFPGSVRVPDALYTIGWANFRQRKFDAADVAFNQLIKAYPSSAYVAEAQLRRGDAFFINERYEEAIGAYGQVERRNPTLEETTHAAYQAALAHMRLGRLDAADSLLQIFIGCYAATSLAEDAVFRRAEIAMRRGEYHREVNLLGALVGRAHQEKLLPPAYELLAAAHMRLGEPQLAAGALSIALEKFPKSSMAQGARRNIDDIMGSRDEPSRAGASCGDADTYLAMGRACIYQETGRPDEAIREYRELADRVAGGECLQNVWLGLARSHLAANRPAQAIDTLRLMLERYPSGAATPTVLLMLGDAHLLKGDSATAIAYLEQLRATYPDSTETIDARMRIAAIHALHGARDTASALLQENLRRFPSNVRAAWSWLDLARIDTTEDRRDTIRRQLSVLAGRNDSLGTEALFALAYLDIRENHLQDAIGRYDRIAGQDGMDMRTKIRALIASGKAYELLGLPARARETYERVLRNCCEDSLKKQAEEHIQALGKL